MSGPVLVVVESNTTGSGRQFCAAARRRGLSPVMVSRDPARYPYVAADQIPALVVDTADDDAVLAACRDLGDVRGVTSSSEYAIATAARVAARLGLPCPDAAAVARARDKAAQRAALRRAGVPVPEVRVVTTAAAAADAAAELGPPVVVKPVQGSGSMGVRFAGSPEEARQAALAVLSTAPPRALVERFVAGPEFSAESFGTGVVALTRKHLGPLPHFVEIGHDVPAVLDHPAAAELRATGLAALAALGLGWGPAHTELRLSPGGAVVIEVNPRLAGGMIPELVLQATGVDLVAATVAQACGERPDVSPTREAHAAIRFLVAPGDGELAGVDGVEAARAVPGVCRAEVTALAGVHLARTGAFTDRIGWVIATAGAPGDAAARAADALDRLDVRLAHPHPTGGTTT